MSTPKSECQLAGWQNANLKTHTEFTPIQKKLATLRARAALAGVSLHTIENDHGETVYIVSKWNLTRELADLDALETWLNRVTGGAA